MCQCVWMGVSVSIQSPRTLCLDMYAWEGTLTSILWYSCGCLNPLCICVWVCQFYALACICKHIKEYIWAHEVHTAVGTGPSPSLDFLLTSLSLPRELPSLPGGRPFLFRFPCWPPWQSLSFLEASLGNPKRKWGPYMAATFLLPL